MANTCTTILNRNAQIAIREEAVEGTAIHLSAAYAGMLVTDPSFTPDFERFDRIPARASLSTLPSITGVQLGTIAWNTELKGSGTASTIPSWDVALRGSGFQRSAVSSIAIGAVTGGPYIPGETVTGGTSLATGRIVGEVADGDAVIFYVPLTGTFQSADLMTGGTSGATSTTSSTPTAAQGYEYRPLSTCPPSTTVAYILDGVWHQIRGARGTVSITGNVGEPAAMNYSFQGVYDLTQDLVSLDIGAVATGPYTAGEVVNGGTSFASGICVEATADGDDSILIRVTTKAIPFQTGEVITGVSSGATATSSSTPYADMMDPTYEETIPEAFLDVGASVHDYATCFSTITMDMANTLAARRCANDVSGATGVAITARDPNGSMDPEMVHVGTEDFFGDLSDGATGRLYFKIGDTAGNLIQVGAPLVEYTNISGGDRDGIATADLTFGMRSATITSTDDELLISHI